MIRKKSRASSPIISVLLMVGIAITINVIIYVWTMNTIDQSYGSKSPEMYESRREVISIDNVWFSQDGTVQIVVRNVGASKARIDSIYVDGILKYSAPSSNGYIIDIGNYATFNLPDVSPTFHLFDVNTIYGNQAYGHYGPLSGHVTTIVISTSTASSISTSFQVNTTTTTMTSTATTTQTITSTSTTTYTTYTTTTSTYGLPWDQHTTTITSTSTVTSTGTTTYTTTNTTTTTITSTITTTITTTE